MRRALLYSLAMVACLIFAAVDVLGLAGNELAQLASGYFSISSNWNTHSD